MQRKPLAPNEITTAQAAEYLGIFPDTVSYYAHQGRIKRIRIGVMDRKSVEDYLMNRSPVKHRAAKEQGHKHSPIREENRRIHKEKILLTIKEYFAVNGCPPPYDVISKKIKLGRSGVWRYVSLMAEEGTVEIKNGHVFPKGLAEKIADLARKEYTDELSKMVEKTDTP